MTRKSILKMLVDAGILALMLGLISYPLTRGLWRHGMMGCGFASLVLIHQALNGWWYRGLREGRWTLRRFVQSAVSLILVADVIVLVTSAVLLAGEVFSFARFPMTNWARSLHVTATAWALVLASLHLGMHGDAFWQRFRTLFGVYARCFMFTGMLIGAACFVQSEMIWDLMHEDEMKLLPETFYEFTGQRLGIVMLFCIAGRFLTQWLQARSRRLRAGRRRAAPAAAPVHRTAASRSGPEQSAAHDLTLEDFLCAQGHPAAKKPP